ncbi:SDR family NAD(P)-dependent oxidoreductase [Homoserinibacter sp. YIM 151385]|uniref:SDR family NAD(P)-dependent oxidoreductase n=1 Tax=Homoserinibacter sp. YIM 151385 TaxID=2985506 RepID=UPI0022F02DA5|nr:SDR family NAD(P)-dependent oxidoreductase [Homoserinibacter sp. YIM 151385]WBU37049.1 SDR family NAD(P)-dependent oxidoreductase [Homoserinibacter sp. YIM 151385]
MGTALVTGGTSGIGAAFARALAARGHDLVLVARDEARLEETAAELRATGRHVEVLSADLSVRADVDRVAARIEDPSRPVDLLVNNAGFGVHWKLTASDVEVHDRAMEVMVRAVLVLGGAAGRAMRERGHGAIVNVSSTAGFITMGAYSAIKAWVTSYTEGLSNELHGTGVTVTALCPGWVRTEFHQRAGIRSSSIPESLWLDADALVATSLRDVDRGRVISMPSIRYRVLIWFTRHLPRTTVRWISRRISSSRA